MGGQTEKRGVLGSAPRGKSALAVAGDLYATHSGFRFLSNFVVLGALTVACLTFSSNLSAPGSESLFGLVPTGPAASADGPTASARPATPAAQSGSSPLAAEARPANAGQPAEAVAPTLADYQFSPADFAADPFSARAALQKAATAAQAGAADADVEAVLRDVDPAAPGVQMIEGLLAVRKGGVANAESGFLQLERAAQAGSTAAMALYGLARLSPLGGAPADTAAGRQWLQRAADAGDAQAARLLAQAYLSGATGVRDPITARQLYQRAAQLGDKPAALALARTGPT